MMWLMILVYDFGQLMLLVYDVAYDLVYEAGLTAGSLCRAFGKKRMYRQVPCILGMIFVYDLAYDVAYDFGICYWYMILVYDLGI